MKTQIQNVAPHVLKRILNISIWTLISLYFLVILLLHIPYIQNQIGKSVGDILCNKLGTKVSVGRIDLGFINRLIVDDFKIYDKQNEKMLLVSRASVKIDIFDFLAHGKIVITSSQFFGTKANLYRNSPDAAPNFQFVIDSLASKDTTKHTPLDLQISSLIIRNGDIKYRCRSKSYERGKLSPDNIHLSNISAHFIINKLSDDSVNVRVKKLAFTERSGLAVKSLSFHAVANRQRAQLEDLDIKMPNTHFAISEATATYKMQSGKLELPTLQYNGTITSSEFTPSDLSCISRKLEAFDNRFSFDIDFVGTATTIAFKNIRIDTSDRQLHVAANGSIFDMPNRTSWFANITDISVTAPFIKKAVTAITGKDMPKLLEHVNNASITGYVNCSKTQLAASGKIKTNLGEAKIAIDKHPGKVSANINTDNFDLKTLTGNDDLGNIAAKITADGKDFSDISIHGDVSAFDYKNYKYKGIKFCSDIHHKTVNGHVTTDDPNLRLDMSGEYDWSKAKRLITVNADLQRLAPHALHLTKKWRDTSFALNLHSEIKGTQIHDFEGHADISRLSMASPNDNYDIASIHLETGYSNDLHYFKALSDFGQIDVYGHFNYKTLANSIKSLIASKLSSVPGLHAVETKEKNDFIIEANINDAEWLRHFFAIPVSINAPLTLNGDINEKHHKINLACSIPSVTFNNRQYNDIALDIQSPNDSIRLNARMKRLSKNNNVLALGLNACAYDDKLDASMSFSNNDKHSLKGIINTNTTFAKNAAGVSTAYINIMESTAAIGDTVWHIAPSSIVYNKNALAVDGFSIRHNEQLLSINGAATKHRDDSLTVTLNDIDVNYILNLIDFHTVEFSGMASGQASVVSAFSESPQISANLDIRNFMFENGRMGTLYANVGYDTQEQRININAVAKDGPDRKTLIEGYVSPKQSFIDLSFKADNTRAEFLESFCGSFMQNIAVDLKGGVRLAGPLDNINITGQLVANGSLGISSLNTTYFIKNDTIDFIPDEIIFAKDTIYDRNGNIGIVDGSVFHRHLTNLSYDLNIKARNLLSYDTHSFNGDTFYGTAYATGDCSIKGRSGEVTIDIDATPNANSILVYKVNDQSDLSSNDFIQWYSAKQTARTDTADNRQTANNDIDDIDDIDVSTDIKLNFLINCNTDATVKLLMDEQTGDYITLNGDGVIRANYFNKGTFDMYGNYIVDHGVYKLTIQNIIKKDFTFQKGGTISFGGNPYDAAIDLKAMYVLNSVSLSDLNIGRSFSNNNTRVNCLMNVTGTPGSPKVDFNLDMPTLGNDAKQMVFSLFNAEEEMNQQVLYLLAVGRFYTQGSNANNEASAQYSQASLAMQSFLSGTISQQINNVLSNVIKNNNWNFGANISTGTEGFNNAEYEGLLSGRLLNNRLLINGQFGYRDKANSTTSFIGDFDIRYLLFPNGNLSINVYNKTNDRYFTRNSLNTQGLGLIMKKDFNGIGDLFHRNKKKRESTRKQQLPK